MIKRGLAALAAALVVTALGSVVGTATVASAAPCLPESAAQGAIGVKYRAMGGGGSPLGCPTSYELTNPDGTGKRQVFAGGTIYWSNGTGAHPVWGKIGEKWGELGWEGGHLGYPTSDELTNPDGAGKRQVFQNGSIYWKSDTGAHPIWGAIGDAWGDLGWEAGDFGYPTSDVVASPDGVGVYSEFQRGWIYWSPGLTCTVNAKETTNFPNARTYAADTGKRRCGETWREILSRVVGGRYQAHSRIDIKFSSCEDCPVAGVGGNQLTVRNSFINGQPNDLGMLSHELTHVAQAYPNNGGGWMTEGVADWLRFALGQPAPGRGPNARCDRPGDDHYTDGYECAAAFLGYLQRRLGSAFIPDLNGWAHAGNNTSNEAVRNWISTRANRSLDLLWADCRSADCTGGRS